MTITNKIRLSLQTFCSKIYIAKHKNRDIFLTLFLFWLFSISPILIVNFLSLTVFLYLLILIIYSRISNRISLITSDIQDKVRFHYSKSIFDNGKNSFWRCDWTRKYDKNGKHKKFKFLFWKFDIPAFMYDAWHLFKIIEIWSEYNSAWYLIICIFPEIKGLEYYIIFIIIASIRVYFYHIELFYGGIFIKYNNVKQI